MRGVLIWTLLLCVHAEVTDKPVVTLQPNWPQVYIGESLIVRCEISGENTQWEYEWKTSSVEKPPNLKEFRIQTATPPKHEGKYQCKGKMSGERQSDTEWSDVLWIKVMWIPDLVLTASASWLSPGDSLTLSCDVDHPSAGWKFYWYKEIRTSSDTSYEFNILPMSINGTATATITINEPSHTARYACAARRGNPIFYTPMSNRKFVWFADDHPLVSLKVSPERAQHFVSDSVLLTCEGNVTNSRVRFYTDDGTMRYYPTSVCKITDQKSVQAVSWCVSELGFSNAVNITRQKVDIILVSPVHPVPEGESLTIGCQLRTGHAPSPVSFYKDDKLVQSDGDANMTISNVSKSDEGFYKCQSSGKESPQSWISIKSGSTPEVSTPVGSTPEGSTPEGSSPQILLFVGLASGLLFIILLLVLLFCYKKSKGFFLNRNDEPIYVNQSSAVAPPLNQTETQTYSSLLYAHENAYETIARRGNTDEDQ